METKVGYDGVATNARLRQNMFEEEQVLSEKEKMRLRLVTDKDEVG